MKLIECPRDAMQGIKEFIPTKIKANYINTLLKVGFDTIDVGSFVSSKAIPQMADTAHLLEEIDLSAGNSKLLAIVANKRGAEDACQFEEISVLGFPFSVSETFQQRNTNSSIEESLKRVSEIQSICKRKKKELLVYISMAFGNPYGDKWDAEIVMEWAYQLYKMGIRKIALADTIGVSTPKNISQLFSQLIPQFETMEIGAHLHSRKENSQEKIKAAYKAGCVIFDAAIHGFGGCPMAEDNLTGNISTQELEQFCKKNKIPNGLNLDALKIAYEQSWAIFNKYH
jgi:hydroxymethylglutaryl-CoA lyase